MPPCRAAVVDSEDLVVARSRPLPARAAIPEAEHVGVEALAGLDVVQARVVPDEGARLVQHRRADHAGLLPHAEDAARRVGGDEHPPAARDVHRAGVDRAAVLADQRGRGVGVVAGQVTVQADGWPSCMTGPMPAAARPSIWPIW